MYIYLSINLSIYLSIYIYIYTCIYKLLRKDGPGRTARASISTSSDTALRTASTSGGSMIRRHTDSEVPGRSMARMRSTSCSSGTRLISGACTPHVTTSKGVVSRT